MQTLLDEMLDADVISPSSSPWASPIVLVEKKDGSTRFCVDYRRLNRLTRKDAFPLPRIEQALDALHGARIFSTLDLQSGFWQVPLTERAKEKSAFTTPFGLFQFNKMPFGLTNAPATFQRLMEAVLRGLTFDIALIYLDDIIVFARDFDEHLSRLRQVLQRLRSAGLELKPSKCRFGWSAVQYLGYVIDERGVGTDPQKIAAVSDWPTPASVTDLRAFLGLASYYR